MIPECVSNLVDLDELSIVRSWIESRGYKIKYISFICMDNREPQFVGIYVDCAWKEWKELAKELKRWINKIGLTSVASRIILIGRFGGE